MDGIEYLKQVRHGFEMYKTLGEKAMAQVPAEADFDVMLDETSNSIAVLVQLMVPADASAIRPARSTTRHSPSGSLHTSAAVSAESSPSEWPAKALARAPELIARQAAMLAS